MIGAAPAAPAFGGAAFIMVGVGVCLLWLFLYGLKNGYEYSLGSFLRQLARMVDDIWIVGGTLAAAFAKADDLILDGIGRGLQEVESVMVKYWHGWEWLASYTWDTLSEYAGDIEDAFRALVGSTIPQAIDLGTAPLDDAIARFRRTIRALYEQELARFRRGIDSLRRDIGAERLRAMRGIDEVYTSLRAQLRALEHRTAIAVAKGVGVLRRPLDIRIGRLEALLGAGILTGAAIAALTRVFPYWQCTNVKRFNRMVCRAPIGALDDLLGLALLTVGSLSIVEFAKAMAPVTDFVTGEVHQWITED